MSWQKDALGVLLVFLTLEVTAAVWHLLLFRDFYAKVTSEVERPFEEYVIPYLMITNLIRSGIIVVFFKVFLQGHSSAAKKSVSFGGLLGAVSGLMAVEYYGVWEISSIAWSFVESSWAVLQGVAVGLVLGYIYR